MKELIIKKGDKQITVADKEDVMDALDNKSDNTHNHDGTYIKTGTGTVTSTNIADGTIVNGDIANTTITGGKLVSGTITATQLASNAVETAKIKNANVTTAKIADSAVTSAKIADKTIVNTDIADDAAIAYSKLSGVASSTDYRLTNKRAPINNSIPANSDLDDFKDAGFYYCQGDVEVAPTIVNQPLTSNQKSFSMIVELISSTRVVQKLTYYYTKDTYIRTNINGGWSIWNRVLHSGNYSDYANKTTVTDNLTTDSSTNALSAKQGKWLYDNKASSSHAHGNISNTGAIGTTANLPVITTTSGKLTTGSFGTGANTFCQGNDSRLSDARTPTSHAHGNITNTGAIGSTANLPVITGSSGKLTTGSFGTGANTFCQGNDSRLSDARTPTSHAHGNITNTGAIGSTANLPVITGSSGKLTTGSFGTTAGTVCQGNDSRLSDARTPTSHSHGNITNNGAIGSTANLPVITGSSGKLTTGSFGTGANTFCQGNDSRITNAVGSACKIGFSSSGTTPATSLEFSVSSGTNLYAIIRDANGNIPSNITKGYMVVNGSFQSKTVHSETGTISAQMNVKATFLVEAGFFDANGWVVASATCKVTVS